MAVVPQIPHIPHIPHYTLGEPGSAALLEGTPSMILWQQPDAMLDAGQIASLTIRAASVRGAGHRYDGSARQDDFCFGTAGPNDDWLVGVVADGVSAGARSHVAARVAVRMGVQLVSEHLEDGPPETINWDELIGTIAGHILLQARKDTGDANLDARSAADVMATTLALFIMPVAADADGVRRCTVLPIGDTSVWILRSTAEWESVTDIKNADAVIASSAVFALPLLPAGTIVPIQAVLSHGDALFAVTDGIGDPLGAGGGDVGRALASVWSSPPNRYEFAAQVDFGRRSHTDDRTVVAVWPDRVETEEAPPASMTSGEPTRESVDLAPDSAPPRSTEPSEHAEPAAPDAQADPPAPPDELPPPEDLAPVSPFTAPQQVTWQPTQLPRPWTSNQPKPPRE